MPKHYAVNTNIVNGSIVFNTSKIGTVIFDKPFTKVPITQITLSGDTSSSVPYKASVTTTQMTVKFQTNYTGIVDWVALER